MHPKTFRILSEGFCICPIRSEEDLWEEIPRFRALWHYGTILRMKGWERAWARSTWPWESRGVSLRPCRIQPWILKTDSSALECISPSGLPSCYFSCRFHSLAGISWPFACISKMVSIFFWSRNCHSGHVPCTTNTIQECVNTVTYLWCFFFYFSSQWKIDLCHRPKKKKKDYRKCEAISC